MQAGHSVRKDIVLVRGIRAGDFDGWSRLWKGYQAFYAVDIPDAVSRVTWSRLNDEGEPMHGALAFVGDQAVGMVNWLTHRSTWTDGDYCYLQDLFVEPEARSGGVGRRLIEHVYAHAADHGCPRVYWLTQETNYLGRLLYDRVGDQSGFIQYRKALT